MLKKLLTVLLLFCFAVVYGQKGKLIGKITSTRNEALSSVSIKVKGTTIAVQSSVEGTYILQLDANKKFELTFTYVGALEKTVSDVTVTAGTETVLDVVMEDKKQDNNVVVKAPVRTAKFESVNSGIQFQRNSNTVAQVITAEAIRKSPDRNTGEILKRVPGTSVQEGKYLIVRGLSDRYNQAMLNGVLLSSTEPDRKTFSFDIFPAAVIDNIIINKAFVPELPGEWAGGLVQVNTKDIPTSNYFNVQIGTGFNTNVIGKDYYGYKGGGLDFLGFDDKTRALPDGLPNKSTFAALLDPAKAALGAKFENNWSVNKVTAMPNVSLQGSGGFSGQLFKKKVGGIVAINYNKSTKLIESKNSYFSISNNLASPDFIYDTKKYADDILWGGIANFTVELNSNNKVSFKNLFNVNSTNYASLREGQEYLSGTDNVRARELALKTNIFFNTQLSGEHNLPTLKAKLNWFGSFNILDQYIPEQRRLEYIQTNQVGNYAARISGGQSQKSGSIFYSNLSDYIYTIGTDVTKRFTINETNQSVKAGYFLQIKDRLFDSRPFFIKTTDKTDNSLKLLSEDQVFAPSNFGEGKFGFDEFSGNRFRYLANSILNAGFLQFDNALTSKLRLVWGVRYEDFDQLIGSVKMSDTRFVNTRQGDWLPALNFTYKLDNKTNIRLSGSQTVVRPEFRELSTFAFFDFDLGASVLGNQNLVRTKITNFDLRYELYPRPGELVTFGLFYKYFKSPIELFLNQSGAGSSNTFNYFDNAQTTAEGFGVEFEMRKKLDFNDALKNFTLTSNLSYIYNRVKNQDVNLNRPMQGQSPYIINLGLQYELAKVGLSSTLLFNQIGRRIMYVGNGDIPAIWEAPRPLLDFQIAKKIIKNRGELKLNVSDIINQTANLYHDLNDDGKFSKTNDALAISRKYGTTFSLTFSYSFTK